YRKPGVSAAAPDDHPERASRAVRDGRPRRVWSPSAAAFHPAADRDRSCGGGGTAHNGPDNTGCAGRASGSGGVAGLSRQSGAGADGHLSGDFGGLSGYGCFERGVTPFLGLPAVLPLPLRIPGIAEATLSTGANIVSGAAYDSVAAQMVDMETYACLRACMRFDLPLIALRGISDGKAELNHVSDWTEYLHIIDEKLAAAVDQLAQALS